MNINDKIHQGAESVTSKATDVGHDVGAYAGKAMKALFDSLGIDKKSPMHLLERLGLVRRPSTMAQVGSFVMGLLVGGGTALILAPMSGEKLRLRLREEFLKFIRAADSSQQDGKGDKSSTEAHEKAPKESNHHETGLARTDGQHGLDKRQNVDLGVAKKHDDEAALNRAASDGMRLKTTSTQG